MRFECTVCKKSFAKKETLDTHKKIVHEGQERKMFNCDLCDKTFAHLSSLQYHIKSVHEGGQKRLFRSFRLRPCSICKEVFKSHSKLKAHQLKHDDERNQGFDRFDEENEQIKTEENLECNKCKLLFASNQILQMHKIMVQQEQ